MRLVTRCPACATTFKVVRDQLRISDGWVRCGRCSEVFDATLDLYETDDDGVPLHAASSPSQAQQPASRGPQENLLPPSTSAPLPAMNWPSADLLDLGGKPGTSTAPHGADGHSSADAGFEDPVPAPTFDDDEAESKEPWFDEMMASTQALQEALQSASNRTEPGLHAAQAGDLADVGAMPVVATPSLTEPSPIEQAVNSQLQKALRRERIKALRLERTQQKERERAEQAAADAGAAAIVSTPDEMTPSEFGAAPTELMTEPPSSVPSFVGVGSFASSSPRSPIRRVLWALACLVALLLQVAREERDALVAREPRLRPALQQLCDWTGCELSALRQINSITIEGASFSREKEGDAYRLAFTLRNGSRVPLAMPSIELTLLDTQERALVRRVLSPAQFSAPAVLGPGAENNTSLPMQLSGSEAAGLGPVAGYNLVAFYP